jgi:hypothetical protein
MWLFLLENVIDIQREPGKATGASECTLRAGKMGILKYCLPTSSYDSNSLFPSIVVSLLERLVFGSCEAQIYAEPCSELCI